MQMPKSFYLKTVVVWQVFYLPARFDFRLLGIWKPRGSAKKIEVFTRLRVFRLLFRTGEISIFDELKKH